MDYIYVYDDSIININGGTVIGQVLDSVRMRGQGND